MFRRIFLIDGYVMIVLGLLLVGFPNPFAPPPHQILNEPGTITLYPPNEDTLSWGVTLIGLGVASLAVGYSRNSTLQRIAAVCFLAGHLLLGFAVWALMPVGATFAGFIVFDLLIWPVPAFFYGIFTYESARISRQASTTEQEIREAAGQEERNRLAQDLHDSVKQQIFSVQTDLATAEARWDDDTAGARAAIERARKTARDAMSEMSALLDRLRRDPIESAGLVEALRRQCEALGFQTGATVSTAFGDLPVADIPTTAMTPVFRIAQESLANIARHARAKHVALQLNTNVERNSLFLEIRDDGRGFDTESAAAGMGLRNMRLRAQEIGAELDIRSKAGEGTITRLWLPLIDVKQERTKHHIVRLLAVLIPAIVAAGLMRRWDTAAPFLFPFVVVGAAFAAFHLIALKRVQST